MLKSINDQLMRVKFYYDTLSIIEQADPNSKIRANCLTELNLASLDLAAKIDEYEKVQ